MLELAIGDRVEMRAQAASDGAGGR
jgi:hypothetical protein